MRTDARNNGIIGGGFTNIASTFSTFNMNSNNALYGNSFWMFETKSVVEVSVRCNTVVGSLGANDIECHLQEVDEVTGNPSGVDLGVSSTRTALGNNTYVVFTFSTPVELTKNKQYCWFLKNVNASAGSNYIIIGYLTPADTYSIGTATVTERRLTSTNGGSTWARNNYAPIWRISFSDNTDIGIPLRTLFLSTFGQRAVTFKTLKGMRMKLRQILLGVARGTVNTATAKVTIRKTDDFNTVLATSMNIVRQSVLTTSGGSPTSFFFENVVLEPDTKYTFYLEYVSGSSGMGLYYAELENNIGSRIMDLRPQIGGGINNNGTDLYEDPSYYYRVIMLSLIGEYEQPFYSKSTIKGA